MIIKIKVAIKRQFQQQNQPETVDYSKNGKRFRTIIIIKE